MTQRPNDPTTQRPNDPTTQRPNDPTTPNETTNQPTNLILIFLTIDMRKALPRDKDKKSMIPRGRDVHPSELQHP
eukprot:Pgem_evm1s17568